MASLVSFSLNKTATPTPKATSLISSTIETLDQKFGRKGIKFSESGDIELTVRNGSSLKLQIPNGHITSYRPKVYWKDDGYEEVLHTIDGPRGGIALVINEDLHSKGPPTEWTVKDVDSDSIDALQVELSSSRGSLDISYVVSLYPLCMATAVIVKNNGLKAVNLNSAIVAHFKFKKRSGSGIQGLKGCSYCTHPPLSSPFEILSPSETIKSEDPGFFSFGWEPEKKPGIWTVQDDPITVLKHKLSRVYAAPPAERSKLFHRSAPSKYEIIDQGRRNSVTVERNGFQELYMFSPGSEHEWYGKYSYICIGHAALLEPIILNAQSEWSGGLQLWNPNS